MRHGPKEVVVSRIIDHRDVLLLKERIEPQDLPLRELTNGDDMPGGLDGQRCHDLVPPVVRLRKPLGILQKREVVDGHHLVSDQDGTQTHETEYDIVSLIEEEKGQDALFPEMGIASTIVNNLQAIDVVTVLNRSLGTNDGKRQLLLCHRLTHVGGIAFDTRHGLRQESAVDVDHISIT